MICRMRSEASHNPQRRVKTGEWQTSYATLLPSIRRHLECAFRRLGSEARSEAIQEALANATLAYARLHALGKTDIAYAAPLARYAVAQVRDGRRVAGGGGARDVLSPRCQRLRRVTIEHLTQGAGHVDDWQQLAVEDRRASPADTAALRIDFREWLKLLPHRERRLALLLASGESTSNAARTFGLSAGRISQVRKELQGHWYQFQGEQPPANGCQFARPRAELPNSER